LILVRERQRPSRRTNGWDGATVREAYVVSLVTELALSTFCRAACAGRVFRLRSISTGRKATLFCSAATLQARNLILVRERQRPSRRTNGWDGATVREAYVVFCVAELACAARRRPAPTGLRTRLGQSSIGGRTRCDWQAGVLFLRQLHDVRPVRRVGQAPVDDAGPEGELFLRQVAQVHWDGIWQRHVSQPSDSAGVSCVGLSRWGDIIEILPRRWVVVQSARWNVASADRIVEILHVDVTRVPTIAPIAVA